jgi:hypothetical protein
MLPHVGLVYGNALDNAVFARYYAVSKSIEYYIKKEKEKSQANVQSIRIIIGTPTSEKDSQIILSKKSFQQNQNLFFIRLLGFIRLKKSIL